MSDERQFDSGYQRPTRSWYYEDPAQLYQGLLSNASATLYTAPAAPTSGPPPKVRLDEIVIANTDSSARAVTLYVVASGGGAGNANTILPAFSIAANTTLAMKVATMIEAGGTLRGFADTTNKVCVTVSGTRLLTIGTA